MNPLKILLLASEIAPFAKTGGLADVAASLARFLDRDGHDVQLLMPMYRQVEEAGWDFTPHPLLQDLHIDLGGRSFTVSVSTAPLPKSAVRVLFLRCPELYRRDGIYTLDADEHLRFALLNLAALHLCQHQRWAPDVIHCNDWHTALAPLYLRVGFRWDGLFQGTRTLLTIHNLGYQGVFSSETLGALGLGDHAALLHQGSLGEGRINFLETGLLYADALTTVSETYAREIQTDEGGMGLAGLLRERSESLFGIVNGVDYTDWNPATDTLLPHTFSPGDMRGKAANKQVLMERFGLAHDPAAPVFGVVSRLTGQKGFELLPDILPVFLQQRDLRLVVLGSGEQQYEKYFQWLRDTFPDKVGFHCGYDDGLAHLIEAGSDLFVMPSRYEPCGLNQMYSLKYGTVPIVRRTGGLADTVERYDPVAGTGTGFVFDDFTSDALYHTAAHALDVWNDRTAWDGLVRRGMERDFSWDRQGRRYIELYARLAGR